MRAFRLLLVAILLSLSLVPGASAKGLPYFVNTESLAVPDFAGPKTYVLLPAHDDLVRDELQYQYFVPYVVAALKSRGLTPVANDAAPDLVIYFDFGVGEPKEQTQTRQFPIFGQTGVRSSTTTGYVSRFSGNFSATTTFTPTFGVTGFSSETRRFTTYTKRISFEGYFATLGPDPNKPRPAFRTNIYEFGESPDLRRAFPVMLAGSLKLIATTTSGMVERGVREDHRIVKDFKKLTAAK